jgi:hypothetical protein
MKKIISIKSNENHNNFYFTHKNGVDIIQRDDIVDLQILNTYIKNQSDWFRQYFEFAVFYLIFFSIWAGLEPGSIPFDYGTFLYLWIFGWFIYGIAFILSKKNPNRKILKIYSKTNVYKYKIGSMSIFSELYVLFNKEINKYLPEHNDEIVLYTKNPDLDLWFYTLLKKISGILSIIAVLMILAKIILPENLLEGELFQWRTIILGLVGSFVGWAIMANKKEGSLKVEILTWRDLLAMELQQTKLGMVDGCVFFERTTVKKYLDKNFIMSEQYRDIGPLLIAHINYINNIEKK